MTIPITPRLIYLRILLLGGVPTYYVSSGVMLIAPYVFSKNKEI